jgi:hypothetical protein
MFALWQSTALLMGATPLVVPFLLAEIGFGLAQALPVGARVPDRQATA